MNPVAIASGSDRFSVARASLEELRLDYEDILRHRGLPEWSRDDLRRAALIDRRPKTADDVAAWAVTVKNGQGGRNGLGGQGGQGGQAASTESTTSKRSIDPTYFEISANGIWP